MGKPKKQRKKFQYDRNRRKEWKQKTKQPNIECLQVKNAWDKGRSVVHNLRTMGLAADPNKIMPIPTAKELLGSNQEIKYKRAPKKRSKSSVITELEEEANAPQPLRMRFSEPEVSFCTYMMERYGEDYKKMARDEKNYYQETPKQIKRKINQFKNIPAQYNAYLESKKRASDAADST